MDEGDFPVPVSELVLELESSMALAFVMVSQYQPRSAPLVFFYVIVLDRRRLQPNRWIDYRFGVSVVNNHVV